MIRNSQPMVSVPVDTLQEIRAVLIGIEDDLACNLTPRSERLRDGFELIRGALNAPRSFGEMSQ